MFSILFTGYWIPYDTLVSKYTLAMLCLCFSSWLSTAPRQISLQTSMTLPRKLSLLEASTWCWRAVLRHLTLLSRWSGHQWLLPMGGLGSTLNCPWMVCWPVTTVHEWSSLLTTAHGWSSLLSTAHGWSRVYSWVSTAHGWSSLLTAAHGRLV